MGILILIGKLHFSGGSITSNFAVKFDSDSCSMFASVHFDFVQFNNF